MLTVGTYLADRYEIVSKIGAGGMSDVYKAKDHILGRFVAIKVLRNEFSEDRSFVAKFRTEAQSAAGLEHPNIVNIYDVGSEEGLYYIVMEYVEGITLKTYIEKKGQLSFKESVSIAIQVARGIEAAHNKQITHRDIKPQNIIISTEGKVKVTDFGIARAASSNTISSDVMGSVHYSSPEQARNGFVDGRSDIYSLGIVMYEMVTGRVPFDGDTTVAVAIQHLQEEMVPPSNYAPNLPISMEKIILKCTQKNPDRRYQTIEELLNDLRRALVNPDEDFVVIAPLVDNFLQPPHSLCANFPLEPFFAGGRGFLFLVLQLGGIVSGMLVLLQLAFQLQRAFLCKRFLQRFVLRRTVRRILPIGKAILIHFKVGFLYLLLGIFFLIGKIIIPQQFILPWFHDSFTSSKKYFSFSQKTVPIYTPFFSY